MLMIEIFIIVLITTFFKPIADIFNDGKDLPQELYIRYIQAISLGLYFFINLIIKLLKEQIKFIVRMENQLYGTEMTSIFYKKESLDGVNDDYTNKNERNIIIMLEVVFKTKYLKWLFKIIIKNLELCFELERGDITIESLDGDTDSTVNGFKYKLEKIGNKAFESNNLIILKKEIKASIDFDKEEIVNRNEDDVLYGIIKNSKNDKKMNFLSRIFMKEDSIYHKIKIVTERNC